MTKVAEDNQWWRGKRPIVDEYLDNQKQIERVVAGRGFLSRPGYLGGMITDVERGMKFKLSDLNYEIVKEAVERQLTQDGHDYDIDYKGARVAWELEKTILLTELDQEFSNLKRERSFREDELARLRIETELRSLEILAAKVAIETEMEGLRQEQIGLQTQVLPYEATLAQERLATAQAKLAVIPYIEEIITAQQSLLVVSEANADRKTALISEKERLEDKKHELVDAKSGYAVKMATLIVAKEGLLPDRHAIVSAISELISEKSVNLTRLNSKARAMDAQVDAQLSLAQARKALIPKYMEKSAAWDAYLLQLENYISVREEIAAVKEALAELEMTEAEIKGELIQVEIMKIAAKQLLQEARIALAEMRIVGDELVLNARVIDVWDRLSGDEGILARKTATMGNLVAQDIDRESYVQGVKIDKGLEASGISKTARADSISESGEHAAAGVVASAQARANAKITSSLIHILG